MEEIKIGKYTFEDEVDLHFNTEYSKDFKKDVSLEMANQIEMQLLNSMGVPSSVIGNETKGMSGTEIYNNLVELTKSLEDEEEASLRKVFADKYSEEKEHDVNYKDIYVFAHPKWENEFKRDYSWIKFDINVPNLIIYEDIGLFSINPYKPIGDFNG